MPDDKGLLNAWRRRRAGLDKEEWLEGVRGQGREVAEAIVAEHVLPALRELERDWAALEERAGAVSRKIIFHGVWLGGSRASGTERERSDWDIIVPFTVEPEQLGPEDKDDYINFVREEVFGRWGGDFSQVTNAVDFIPIYGKDPWSGQSQMYQPGEVSEKGLPLVQIAVGTRRVKNG